MTSFSTFWVKISQNWGSQKGPYFSNQEGPFWIQGSHSFKSQEQPLKMKLSVFENFESQKPDHEYRTLADLKKVPTIISIHIYIYYSQALRVVERCSSSQNRDEHLASLEEKFKERNYPIELISTQFEQAKKKRRKDLIFKERRKKKGDDKVRLLFTHNQANPPINLWLRDCKRQLERNDQAKGIGKRMQVAFKQPRNLQKIVGGCKSGPGGGEALSPNPGCFKCGRCRVLCPKINETKKFKSTATQKSYTIKQHVNCTSDFVIYLGTCLKCKGQYIGKSQTILKVRHSNHKQEIKKRIGGLGHHYGGQEGCGYENLTITIIEQVAHKTSEYLAEREVYWQHQLRCYVENGYGNHCRKKEM